MRDKRFWVSWFQLSDDYRPLQDPPQPENIKAWWCSGSSEYGATLCAIVDAVDEDTATSCIENAWGIGDVGDFRFVEEREDSWFPGDRFPITKDWEKSRLGLKGNASNMLAPRDAEERHPQYDAEAEYQIVENGEDKK